MSNILNPPYRYVNKDKYGDKSIVTAHPAGVGGYERGVVELEVRDGDNFAFHDLKPKQARRLATSLLVAANIAQGVIAIVEEEQ